MWGRLPAAVGLSAALVACSHPRGETRESAWLVVVPPASGEIDLSDAKVRGSVRSITLSGSKLAVELDPGGSGTVVVQADGACPVELPPGAVRAGATLQRTISPWLDFGAPRADVGFGTPFVIDVRAGCKEASARSVAWKQASGAPLHDVRVDEGGRRFSATLPRFTEAFGATAPWGVVPLSPRTRGEITLEATYQGQDGRPTTKTLRIDAAARSHGLPNVGLGARVYLGGDGWKLASAPPGAHGSVEVKDGIASLLPDALGTWTLSDREGKELRLSAGKYDETRLDCGRSDCHAEIADVARSSPMATILQRGLDAPFGGDYPACALACHAIGELGLDDGGFVAVLRELGRTPRDLARTGFHDLPPVLRRLGGVGCLGCHGPAAIPEPSARWSILRADVCATCHDAPPAYGHVAAWRASRMARADRDPRTRDDAACARCHTTWGFLGQNERHPPPEVGPVGIACAACHAVHPARPAESTMIGQRCAEALRRDVPVPALLDGALTPRADRSRVCLSCHAPDADGPSATAAALWAGRGGIDPASGEPITGPAPHASVEGGCIGCHRSGPGDLAHGSGHAFQGSRDGCVSCHAEKRPESLQERATALLRRLAPSAPTRSVAELDPIHAGHPAFDRSTPRGRATWDVTMVLEDPAAEVHNAPYARLLLDAAERALSRPSSRPGGAR